MIIKSPSTRFSFAVAICASLLLLGGCASNKTADADAGINDPLENVNRMTTKMNEVADKAVLLPIAKGYRAVTPEGGRIVVANFLRNLNSPVIIGNQILQGDVEGTLNSTARFVINTLAGFGGLFDFAEQGGIPYEAEDFGQTLASWGLGDGMYVVLPLLGPSSIRDFSGRLVDSYADPLRTYLFNIEEEHLHYTRVGAEAVSKREELIEVINDLRANSFDYYAAVRSAYYQNRQALIEDRKGGASTEIPDYEDF